MKKRGLIVLLVLALTGSALACSAIGGRVKGSGRVVTSEIDVSGFSGVAFSGFGNLYIEVGSVVEAESPEKDPADRGFSERLFHRRCYISCQPQLPAFFNGCYSNTKQAIKKGYSFCYR